MLVALSHMQVSVCYLRSARQRRTGMTCFRKNIISFPQDVAELRQLQSFLSTLAANDVVNARVRNDDVAGAAAMTSGAMETRVRQIMAVVFGRRLDGAPVEYEQNSIQTTEYDITTDEIKPKRGRKSKA